MNENIAKVLLSEEEIQKRVKELGRQIHDDYKDKDKIVMIGLLKGAIYFFTDLSLAIDLPLRIDFMVASSYGSGTETSGNVGYYRQRRYHGSNYKAFNGAETCFR